MANTRLLLLTALVALQIGAGTACNGGGTPTCDANAALSSIDISIGTDVTVTWSPTSVCQHRITLTDSQSVSQPQDTTTNSVTYTGLEPCADYTVTVTRLADDGTTGATISGNFVAPGSEPVTSIDIDLSGPGVTATWEPESECQYQLTLVHPDSGQTQNVSGNTFTWSDLTPCTTYTATVAPISSDGIVGDAFSSEEFVVPGVVQVTDIEIADDGNSNAVVTWVPESECEYQVNLTHPVLADQSQNTNGNSYTWTGLTPCTTYTASVAAISSDGTVGDSVSEDFVAFGSVPVTSIDVTLSEPDVTATWEPESECLYKLTLVHPDSGQTQNLTGNTFTWSDLTPCTNYTATVAPISSDGTVGDTVSSDHFVVPGIVQVESVTVTVLNDSTATFTSLPQSECKHKVELTHTRLADRTEEISGSSYTITDLTACTDYNVQFTAIGTDGTEGTPSALEPFSTPSYNESTLSTRVVLSDILQDSDVENHCQEEGLAVFTACSREAAEIVYDTLQATLEIGDPGYWAPDLRRRALFSLNWDWRLSDVNHNNFYGWAFANPGVGGCARFRRVNLVTQGYVSVGCGGTYGQICLNSTAT